VIPYKINGRRVGRLARLRWRLGMKPWHRCPNGEHWLTTVDGLRYSCEYCSNLEENY